MSTDWYDILVKVYTGQQRTLLDAYMAVQNGVVVGLYDKTTAFDGFYKNVLLSNAPNVYPIGFNHERIHFISDPAKLEYLTATNQFYLYKKYSTNYYHVADMDNVEYPDVGVTISPSTAPLNQIWSNIGQTIVGELASDQAGNAVAVNSDGTIIAIGARVNDVSSNVTTTDEGHVRIFRLNSVTLVWEQMGSEINGIVPSEQFGYSVALNGAGTRVAVGAPYNNQSASETGRAAVYDWNGTNWVIVGESMYGVETLCRFGWSIALSESGDRLAVGAPRWVSSTGYVTVYDYNGTSWVQAGNTINGTAGNDQAGHSISLNSSGSRIVLGLIGNASNRGMVKVFDLSGNTWVQKGANIIGTNNLDRMGYSVALNGDGSRMVVSLLQIDVVNTDAGQVRVYQFDGTSWTLVGQVLNGTIYNHRFGRCVDIDSAGNRIVVSSWNVNTTNVYDLSGNTWIQTGYDIASTYSGFSVALSGNGNKVVIGTIENSTANVYTLKTLNLLMTPFNNQSIVVNRNVQLPLVVPMSDSGGAFVYSSSNSSVVSIDGSNNATISGVGYAVLTATQASTETHTSAVVNSSLRVVGNNGMVPVYYGETPFHIVDPSSIGITTYVSADTTKLDVFNDYVTILDVEPGVYNPATGKSVMLAVTQFGNTTNIEFRLFKPEPYAYFQEPVINTAYGDPPYELVIVTDSSGSMTFSSSWLYNVVDNAYLVATGVGYDYVEFIQVESSKYTFIRKGVGVSISKGNPIITNFVFPSKLVSDPPFVIVDPSSTSLGAFTYSNSNNDVALLTDKTFTIQSLGTTVVTAHQAETDLYFSKSVDASFSVKMNPNLSGFSISTKTMEDVFTIQPPTVTDSSGGFVYTSLDPSLVVIEGDVATIVGVGIATIRAYQLETDLYIGTSVDASFDILKLTPTLHFVPPTKTYGDASFEIQDPSSNSTGSFSYLSSDPNVATFEGKTATIHNSGTTVITVIQASTHDYNSTSVDVSWNVLKADTILSNFVIPFREFGGDPFDLVDPSSNQTGTFSFESLDPSVATVSGRTLTINGIGETYIVATQEETTNYNSGSISALFSSKTFTYLSNFNVPSKTFGDSSFELVDPSSNSPEPFVYVSSNETVATIIGKTVTIVGAGTTVITCTQLKGDLYNSASIDASLVVFQATTSLINFNVPSKTFGNEPFLLVDPSSNRNGTFVYASSDETVAVIDGNEVVIVGAGISIITATQLETNDYLSASIDTSFNVVQAEPSLSNFSVSTKTFGDASFTLVDPLSDSDGMFSYSSSNTNIATIVGNVVTIVGAGTTIITATQAETSNFLTKSIDASFNVLKSTTTLSDFTVAPKTFGDASFVLTDPVTNSDGAFYFESLTPSVATIEGRVVTIVGAGAASIRATQGETTNFVTSSITTTLTVSKMTTILSNFFVSAKTYGDEPFELVDPSSNSPEPFVYTSSASHVVINGKTVTINGANATLITAIQQEGDNHTSASISVLMEVWKAPVVLSYNETNQIVKTYGDEPFELADPSSDNPEGGSFTFVTTNPDGAIVVGRTVTILRAGALTIVAYQTETTNYQNASLSISLLINKASPNLANFTIPIKSYGDEPFELVDPSSNSVGSIAYSSLDENVATVVDKTVTIHSAGTTIIRATQNETDNYLSESLDASFVVLKETPILSNFVIEAKTFGDPSFVLIDPSSNRDGAFSYQSLNTSVATIVDNTVTIVGAGTATIRATQVDTTNYLEAFIDASFDVFKADAVLSNFSVPTKMFGELAFVLVDPSSNSNGALSYQSLDTNVATINGNNVTIVGAGTTTIRATQASTTNYNEGFVDASFEVLPANTFLSNFAVADKTFGDASFVLVDPSSNRVGAFSYQSLDTDVVTVVDNVVTVVGAGTASIRATQDGTPNYLSAFIDASFEVFQATPLISNFIVQTQTYGEIVSFDLVDPSSNSDGAFSYTSSDENVATIQGVRVTIHNAGTTLITATQSETLNYQGAFIDASFEVLPGATILSNFAVPTKTFGDASFVLIDPSSNRVGAFVYESSNLSVATIDGNVVTIVGAGDAIITVSQAPTTNYLGASLDAIFEVIQADPALASFVIENKTYVDGSFVLVAPFSKSDGAFNYTSLNLDVADVSGNTIFIVGVGDVIVVATQEETPNYISGIIETTFSVSKSVPTLSNLSFPHSHYGNPPFMLTDPSSNSNGAFSYTSSDTNVATIVGKEVTIHNAGTTLITATQEGTNFFVSATIDASFVVNKLYPVFNLATNDVIQKTFGDASFDLVTSNSDGLFTFESSNVGVASVENNVVTIHGAGTTFLSASQAETNNYSSKTVVVTLNVSKATPVVHSFVVGSKVYGSAPFQLVAPASESDGSFNYTSSDTNVATVFGNTVTIVGTGTTTITATQMETPNYVSAFVDDDLVVTQALPVISNFVVASPQFYGSTPASLVDPSSNSDGAFSFTSSNPSIVSIEGRTLLFHGVGSVTLTATQAETPNYLSNSIDASLSVVPGDPVLTNFVVRYKTFGDAPFDLVDPSSNSDGAFSFTSSETHIATIVGRTVTIHKEGTTVITATQASTPLFNSASIDASFVVLSYVKQDPVLSGFADMSKNYGDASFALVDPSSNSPGAFSYTSSNPTVATLEGNVVTILGVGTSTITATQLDTPFFNDASIMATLTVSQGVPTLTNFVVPSKAYGDASFSLVDPSSNSDGAFSFTSLTPSVATLEGNVVSIHGIGTTIIRATQAATTNYTSAFVDASLVVSKATPSINLTNGETIHAIYGDSFSLLISSNSDGSFNVSGYDPDIVTFANLTANVVGVGSTAFSVTQSETELYSSKSVAVVLHSAKATPTLSNFVVPFKSYEDGSFSLVDPSSNSDGIFSYTSSNEGVAFVVERNVLVIVGVGMSTITATQAPTPFYNGASIDASFGVLNSENLTLEELKELGLTASSARNAGFGVKDLQNASYSTSDILTAGFPASELLLNNFSTQTMRAYYSDTVVLDAIETINATPNPPTITSVIPGDRTFEVWFTDTSNTQVLVTGYKYSLDGGATLAWLSEKTSPATIIGLTNGTAYQLTLYSANTSSTSSSSNSVAGIVASGNPGTPLISSVEIGVDTWTVSFVVDDNGAPIQEHYCSLNSGTFELVEPSGNHVTISNLSSNITTTLTFKVRNANGYSPVSNVLTTTMPRLPEAPTLTSVVAGNGVCSVQLTDGNLYNSNVICYKYKLSNSDNVYTAFKQGETLWVYNLSNYTEYTIQVKTVCSSGESDFSLASASFMPIGLPNAVTLFEVQPRSNGIWVSFNDGNLTSTQVQGYKYSLNNGSLVDIGMVTSPFTISDGVFNQSTYSVAMYAYNAQGTSPKSNVLTCVVGVPAPPTITSAESSYGVLSVYYTNPVFANGTITNMGYSVNGSNVVNYLNSISNPVLISGLPRGVSLSVELVAINSNGASTKSNAITTVVTSVPSRPVITSFELTYESPTTCVGLVTIGDVNSNGFALTGFKYAIGNSATFTFIESTTVPLTIPNLPINTFLSVRVIAVNSVGDSVASGNSRSVIYTAIVPPAPNVTVNNVIMSAGNMRLNFARPSSDVTTYKYSLNNAPFVDAGTNVLPLNIPIENNTPYNVRVIATNPIGDSDPSEPLSRNVQFSLNPPFAPRITSIVSSNQTLTVYFLHSITSGTPVTSYSYNLNGTIVDTGSLLSPMVISGLTNGTSYSVSVRANSAAGPSAFSNTITQTPLLDVPSAPVIVRTTARNQSCILNLGTPVENGSPILGYKYSLNGEAFIDANQTVTPIVIDGLTNGVAYSIRLCAFNALGTSLPSSAISVTPLYNVPSAPILTRVTRGVKKLTLSFISSSPNGSPITNYLYSFDGGATKIPTGKLNAPINILNLVSGQSYTVTLYAMNEVGFSLASNAITSVVL